GSALVAWAALLRRDGPASRVRFGDRRPRSHLAAMAALEPCRPVALGGQVSPWTAGPALAYRAQSWKNRHGPKGQHAAATRWLARQRARVLPGPSCRVTLTRPEARRSVTRAHPKRLANLLLQTAAAAVQARALA